MIAWAQVLVWPVAAIVISRQLCRALVALAVAAAMREDPDPSVGDEPTGMVPVDLA